MTGDEPNAYNDGSWYIIRRTGSQPHPDYHRKRATGRNGAIITHCGLTGGPIPATAVYPVGVPLVACPACLAVT